MLTYRDFSCTLTSILIVSMVNSDTERQSLDPNIEGRINTILDTRSREIILVGQQLATIYEKTPHLGIDVLAKAIEIYNARLADKSKAWGINVVDVAEDGSLSIYIKKHGAYYQMPSPLYASLDEFLKVTNAAVVGFSFTSKEAGYVNQQAGNIQNLENPPLILAGGPHSTVAHESMFEADSNFDMAFIGAGEDSLVKLLGNIENRHGVNDLEGIATKGQVFPRKNAVLRPQMSVPDVRTGQWGGRNVTRYQVNQGCPRNCNFCLQGTMGFQRGDVDAAMNFIKKACEGGPEFLFFEDGDFSPRVNRELIERIAEYYEGILANFNGIYCLPLGAQMRWDDLVKDGKVDMETIRLLRAAHFRYLLISIESVNPKVLESMNKGQLNGMDQSAGMGLLKEVFSALSEHNIEFGISTIAGYEGDDFESFQKTIRTIYALRPREIFVEAAKVYPGTNLSRGNNNQVGSFYSRHVLGQADVAFLLGEMNGKLHLATDLWPEDDGCLTLLPPDELRKYYEWIEEFLRVPSDYYFYHYKKTEAGAFKQVMDNWIM